ncbi:MAG: YciI family protein [Candidatus Dormibacteria bacterium]
MALYAAMLYYGEDQYWTNPEEAEGAEFTPGYGAFGQPAAAAGVLRGREALHPVATATTITVAGCKRAMS